MLRNDFIQLYTKFLSVPKTMVWKVLAWSNGTILLDFGIFPVNLFDSRVRRG